VQEQQILISGVGGQGVLFITRLLAEAAISKGLPVITSETHGMAQRGGTVLSHLKVGEFSSPLIRPHQADVLLALTADNLNRHGFYLKKSGWTVVNSPEMCSSDVRGKRGSVFHVDADRLACDIRSMRSVNLILLGFALGRNRDCLFCSFEEIKTVLSHRLAANSALLTISLHAIETGHSSTG
jgi:indolepyruvate ferredoxin oxidoreductase beta subunit